MFNDNEYYVYVLMDSSKNGKYLYDDLVLDYEPFYVGKGKDNRIYDTLFDKSPFKKNKINKLKNLDIEIISQKVYENLDNETAINLEKKLIKIIGRRDLNEGILVNMTDGGDGRLNSKHDLSTKLKISNSKKGVGIGRKHTDKTKEKMSKSQTGIKNGFYGNNHSDEVKENQSNRVSGYNHPMYGKNHSNETKELLKERRKEISNEDIKKACEKFNKPVLMYDLNMNFIQEFPSVKDTSETLEINESIISKCCRGDIKNPTRYYFKYKNIEDRVKNNKYLIPIGGKFNFNDKKYILNKRNRKTSICHCIDDDIDVIIHEKDFKFIFQKETNNSDIIELYLWMKSFIDKLKLEYVNNGAVIKSNNINIYYNKLIPSSEIFMDKKDIYNLDGVIIFEDEWVYKKEIVKSRLLNLLGKSERIYARKCELRIIEDNSLIKFFLTDNHTQGFVGSKIKLGLYYNNELVSLMTFGNLRKNLNQKSSDGSYELLRFCNKLNTTVVGGASKLFKHFIRNYNPEYIVSYSDNRWGFGNLYENLGFVLSKSRIVPNYFYIVDDKRKGRFGFRKDLLIKEGFNEKLTEVQIQHSRGLYRIFDSGSKKYEYSNIKIK